MRVRVEFHPAASEELQVAYRWYRDRDPSVAREFVREIDTLVAAISQAPERGHVYVASTRRLVCRRFPFLIVYQQRGSIALVLAVAHGRRRPGYWRRR